MRITRKSIGIILLSLPLAASAQEKPEKHAITKIGVNYSVDYSYRNLKTNDGAGSISQDIIRSRNEMEKPIFGFHTGIDFLHQFKKGIVLEGGIQYARYGEQIKDVYSISPNDPGTLGKGTYYMYYDYLCVPIKAGYGFPIGKRITLSATTGLSTNYFVAWGSHYHVTYNDGSTNDNKNRDREYPGSTQFNNFTLASVSSIGIDIRLFGAFSVKVEPTARFFLTPVMNAPIKERPYSYGINTTLFYTFHQKEKPKVGNMSLDF